MYLYFRRIVVLGAWLALVSAPSGAHTLDAKSYGQLKASTKNFAHAKSAVVAMNQPLPSFSLQMLDGKTLSNASLRGRMTLFVLADTQCPCVQAIEGRVRNLAGKYGARLRVVYVFSTPSERPIQISRWMQNHALTFPALLDRDQRLLKMLDRRCSSELYLADKAGILRYHGRMDNETFAPKDATQHDLADAMATVANGKRVARPEAPAMGCAIPRL